MSSLGKTRKWYHIRWFQDYDTKEERKLITKLDILIVPYVFVVGLESAKYAVFLRLIKLRQAYWTKYIDQANISMRSLRVCSIKDLTPYRQCICGWHEGRSWLPG